MRLSRKLALGAAVTLGTLLVVLIAIPLLFRDRIAARLKAELDDAVAARIGWDDVGLSLLRDFPNASLTVDRASIVGLAPFAGDTLAAIGQARLVLDLGSVIGHLRRGEPIVVREVTLRQPAVNLRVLADGRANWNIVKQQSPATTGEPPRAVRVSLRELTISEGRLVLDDAQSRLAVAVEGLEESLRGDFAQEEFTLATRTRADSVSVRFAGVPYLNRVGVELSADIAANLPARRFTVADASLRLNELALAFAGSVAGGSPDTRVDLTFSTPGTDFRDILSLVPAVYASEFARLQTSGTMVVTGGVRGVYGPGTFPAFALRAMVQHGAFRHPDLPLPARDIALDLAIDNPGGHLDSTVVNLQRFNASIGGRPVAARFVLRTPVSDPDVDLRVKGAVNLADLGRTVKLAGVSQLTGLLDADVAMRARLSDVDARRYDRVVAAGTVRAGRVALRTATLPHAVAVDTASLRLTPRTAELTAFAARVGNSDVRATGTLDNILGFVLRGDDLRGRATLTSGHLDLNEWRSDDELAAIPVPARLDLAVKAAIDRATYGALTLANVRGDVRVQHQRATLDELRMEMLRGSMIASGYYETRDPARPTFDLDLRVATVDIPSAFAAFGTVQQLAPIARWTKGSVSGAVTLRGALGADMAPVLPALTGSGSIETQQLAIQDAPLLGRLADALSLEQLRHPTLGALRASFDVVDGRVQVKPFNVAMNDIAMTVAGSNGIDQSLQYDLGLAVPRALFGNGLAKLAARARTAGTELSAGDVVQLGARVTGSVGDPKVSPDFTATAASVRDAAQAVVQAGVTSRVEAAEQKVDSAAEAARQRAREEAERIVAEAERQAATIRAEARALAATVQREANTRADSIMARATNPAARLAAKAATDRLRSEGDERAERIVREADARADAMVAEARRRAEALAPAPG